MNEETFAMIISFPDQNPSFSHGFEAGEVWANIQYGKFERKCIRVENIEVLKAIAAHFGYTATFEDSCTEGWHYMDITKFGLKVIK